MVRTDRDSSNCTTIEEVKKLSQGDGKLYGAVHLTASQGENGTHMGHILYSSIRQMDCSNNFIQIISASSLAPDFTNYLLNFRKLVNNFVSFVLRGREGLGPKAAQDQFSTRQPWLTVTSTSDSSLGSPTLDKAVKFCLLIH